MTEPSDIHIFWFGKEPYERHDVWFQGEPEFGDACSQFQPDWEKPTLERLIIASKHQKPFSPSPF